MNKRDFVATLKRIKACQEAVNWVRHTRGTPAELWDKCERSDWMMFLVSVSKAAFNLTEYTHKTELMLTEFYIRRGLIMHEYDLRLAPLRHEFDLASGRNRDAYIGLLPLTLAEFEYTVSQIRAKYEQEKAPIDQEFDRQVHANWYKYEQSRANLIRSLISFQDIEAALNKC